PKGKGGNGHGKCLEAENCGLTADCRMNADGCGIAAKKGIHIRERRKRRRAKEWRRGTRLCHRATERGLLWHTLRGAMGVGARNRRSSRARPPATFCQPFGLWYEFASPIRKPASCALL